MDEKPSLALVTAGTRWEDEKGDTHDDEPARLSVGAMLGRYRLQHPIGAGTFGQVWSAFDTTLSRQVALKILKTANERARDQLLAEGRALASVDHPNVVRVFDADVIDGRVVLVMELVRGKTLRSWVSDRRPWDAVCTAFAAAAEGLAAAHAAGLAHRDVKPDNMLVDAEGHVVIVDFGIAAPAREAQGRIGTPAYMPPEQRAGGRVDARSDQFALCVALAECIGGKRPFPNDDVEAAPDLAALSAAPREVTRLIEIGLSPVPARRHASLLRLADGLREAVRAHAAERRVARAIIWLSALLAILPTLLAPTFPLVGVICVALCAACVVLTVVAFNARRYFSRSTPLVAAPLFAAGFIPIVVIAVLHAEGGAIEAFRTWTPPLLWAIIIAVSTLVGRAWLSLALAAQAGGVYLAYWWFSDVPHDGVLQPVQTSFRVVLLLTLGVVTALGLHLRTRGDHSRSS